MGSPGGSAWSTDSSAGPESASRSLGLGTGGANVFGQARGAGAAEARTLVRRALDLGVNLFDTAQAYRESEVLLGDALVGVPRSDYVLATKYSYRGGDGALLAPAEVDGLIRRSLGRLRTDVLDVMQIHGLKPADYDAVVVAAPARAPARPGGRPGAGDRRDRVVRRRRSRPFDAAAGAPRRLARDRDGRLQRAQPERGARGVPAGRGRRRRACSSWPRCGGRCVRSRSWRHRSRS